VLESYVVGALERGAESVEEVIKLCRGADPLLVHKLYGQKKLEVNRLTTLTDARQKCASFLEMIPESNPRLSQWWFTLDSAFDVAFKARILANDAPVWFLGTPTASVAYATTYEQNVVLIDVDPEVTAYAQDRSEQVSAITYDVAAPLTVEILNRPRPGVVVCDPPWYPAEIKCFINRAFECLADGGFVLLTLPPLLTRNTAAQERQNLLHELAKKGVSVLELTDNFVRYSVPCFENRILSEVDGFTPSNWRPGDLLVMHADARVEPLQDGGVKPVSISQFPTPRGTTRVFVDVSPVEAGDDLFVVREEFNKSLSRSVEQNAPVNVWTSKKQGAFSSRPELVVKLLENLNDFESRIPRAHELAPDLTLNEIELVAQGIDELIDAGDHMPTSRVRRTTHQIEEYEKKCYSKIALIVGSGEEVRSDGYRTRFQRDRDRVLWSRSLAKLADKTQVFPVDRDDQLRRRLTHTIEVMQLASTISRAFGLNRDLAEAGALIHDIGHCPFGHGGEDALNKTLNRIDERIGGFNHYEQGLDNAFYLENLVIAYRNKKGHGINVQNEVKECIPKHAFERSGNGYSSQERLIRDSKYGKKDGITDSSCHLEGQAVRLADKISYLISDIEDGLRIGCIDASVIKRCRLFSRPPIDPTPDRHESAAAWFRSQRGAVLKLLMEDAINATERRLTGINSLDQVREQKEYLVNFSEEIAIDVAQIWNLVQAGTLHRDSGVRAANFRAAKICSTLLMYYILFPEMIDDRFSRAYQWVNDIGYMDLYRQRVEEVFVPLSLVHAIFPYSQFHDFRKTEHLEPDAKDENLIVDIFTVVRAKDYVAGMTDTSALQNYQRCTGERIDVV